jgi:hypothetical protein
MKQVLSALALATASALAVPALAQTAGGPGQYSAGAVGALETPPNASPGIGIIKLDVGGRSMSLDMSYNDLLSPATAAHIHCCTTAAFAGTAPIAVPFDTFTAGSTSGSYSNTFALGSTATYDAAFLSSNGGTAQGAASALLAAIAANEAYVNIHSTQYPDGEIRGWLVAAPVPEPSEWAMLGLGIGGLMWMGRRRRTDV